MAKKKMFENIMDISRDSMRCPNHDRGLQCELTRGHKGNHQAAYWERGSKHYLRWKKYKKGDN